MRYCEEEEEEREGKRKTVVRKIPCPLEPLESLEPFEPLEPIEPFEPLEPLEPIEPIAGSKTKTKINPLKRMEGDALLPNLPPGLIRASS